ncbi:MAG TPA: NLP/P60 hydrolase [Rhodobacteraceae bacterium]|nr:NLP/P60 hydrolase [Paracoccaceae bacterium]
MTDRRMPPENTSDKTEVKTIGVPVADLRAKPDGKRDRQLIFGEDFRVLHSHDGWVYGRAEKDGYTGYLRDDVLLEQRKPTHFITARSSHIYPEPDFKTEEIAPLSFGARLQIIDQSERFVELANGQFVPRQHIAPIEQLFKDPIEVAERFLGVPYLWGGNSIWGLDCSGLVQAAMNACGLDCPGDADLQETSAGIAIGNNVEPRRGDLFFWKGHVGLIRDENTLLHANAHHMAVVQEPLDAAIARIKAQGDGPVTSRRRL